MFVLFFRQIVFSIFCEVNNIYQVAVLYFICIFFNTYYYEKEEE